MVAAGILLAHDFRELCLLGIHLEFLQEVLSHQGGGEVLFYGRQLTRVADEDELAARA